MFISLLALVAGLLSITIIDAREHLQFQSKFQCLLRLLHFLLRLFNRGYLFDTRPEQLWPYPLIDWTWAAGAFGGMIGVVVTTRRY